MSDEVEVCVRVPRNYVAFVEALAAFCKVPAREIWEEMLRGEVECVAGDLQGSFVEGVEEKYGIKA